MHRQWKFSNTHTHTRYSLSPERIMNRLQALLVCIGDSAKVICLFSFHWKDESQSVYLLKIILYASAIPEDQLVSFKHIGIYGNLLFVSLEGLSISLLQLPGLKIVQSATHPSSPGYPATFHAHVEPCTAREYWYGTVKFKSWPTYCILTTPCKKTEVTQKTSFCFIWKRTSERRWSSVIPLQVKHLTKPQIISRMLKVIIILKLVLYLLLLKG